MTSRGPRASQSSDARLAQVVRGHVTDANLMTQDSLVAAASVGEGSVSLVAEIIRNPIPDDTLSWLGRLSFNTPAWFAAIAWRR